ncbi:MAG TPA: hypothetical protein PLJ11_05070 [Methanomassiliicoccales archaeon]|nr:hypothetical protein [Methanomassiliicoccales archaeon]
MVTCQECQYRDHCQIYPWEECEINDWEDDGAEAIVEEEASQCQ